MWFLLPSRHDDRVQHDGAELPGLSLRTLISALEEAWLEILARLLTLLFRRESVISATYFHD